MPSNVGRSFDALLAAARRGDSAARGQLLEQCRAPLLNYAAVRMAGPLHAKAEPADLVQETFSEAHFSFLRFVDLTEELFLKWLKRILKNNIADLGRHFRAGCRNVAQEQRLDTPLRLILVADDQSPSRVAAQHEEIDAVQLALRDCRKKSRRSCVCAARNN